MRQKTLDKISHVNELIEDGMNAKQACQKVGLTTTTFYKYKQKPAKLKTNKADIFSIPVQVEPITDELSRLRKENINLRKFIKDFL